MSHGTAYTHLFDSAEGDTHMFGFKKSTAAPTMDDLLAMNADDFMAATTHSSPEDWDQQPDETKVYQEPISPMVRRNLDCAQYPQARGSQYEGSDW